MELLLNWRPRNGRVYVHACARPFLPPPCTLHPSPPHSLPPCISPCPSPSVVFVFVCSYVLYSFTYTHKIVYTYIRSNISQERRLEVNIKYAKNLHNLPAPFGDSKIGLKQPNTFVSINFGKHQNKTDVVHANCNPEWDARLFFPCQDLFDSNGI